MTMLYCDECGSRHISVNVWVDANTREETGEGPIDTFYCDDCNEHGRGTEDRREAAAARLAKRRERAA